MSRKNPKTGEWEWDDDDEKDIAKGTETRLRVSRQLQAEEQARQCRRGNHDDDGSGKCAACGGDIKKPEPEPEKGKPKGRHLLTM